MAGTFDREQTRNLAYKGLITQPPGYPAVNGGIALRSRHSCHAARDAFLRHSFYCLARILLEHDSIQSMNKVVLCRLNTVIQIIAVE